MIRMFLSMVLCSVIVQNSANAQPVSEFDEDARQALRELDVFVGQWEVRATGDEDAVTRSTVKWILGGRYLQDKFLTHTGKEGIILRTFTPLDNAYKIWNFTDGGDFVQRGKWDSEKRELSTMGTHGDVKVVSLATVVDDDTIQWGIATFRNGEKISYVEGTNKRVKSTK